jgi:hypothetical protein
LVGLCLAIATVLSTISPRVLHGILSTQGRGYCSAWTNTPLCDRLPPGLACQPD